MARPLVAGPRLCRILPKLSNNWLCRLRAWPMVFSAVADGECNAFARFRTGGLKRTWRPWISAPCRKRA